MKIVISLLILMSLWITEAVAQVPAPGPPIGVTVTPGDRQFTLKWTHPSGISIDDIEAYRMEFYNSAGEIQSSGSISLVSEPTAALENPYYIKKHLINGIEYTFTIRVQRKRSVDPNNLFGARSTPVKVTPMLPAPTDFTATLDDPTIGDRQVTLNWTAPPVFSFTANYSPNITDYEYSQNGGTWTSTGSTSTTKTVTGLKNGISYAFRVRAVRGSEVPGLASRTVAVTPLIPAPSTPTSLNVERVDDTAILTWNPPSNTQTLTRYEYSDDGGSTWKPTGSPSTTYTATELKAGETYTFLVRAVYVRGEGNPQYIYISGPSHSSNAAVLKLPNRRIIQDCPVGWVRSDRFGGPTQRVLLYEVKLDMDLHNLVSIYKPDWVAIYVHPDEALENLEGWKLQVAVPYNLHRDYLLTAENSVVVDSQIEGVEGGFAFIESPEENPFPMIGMGFTGAHVPGFDYRLYDETGRKVDFGIACYKRGGIFQALKDMEDPRVLRNVLLESLHWDAAIYIRSEWTVPVPVNAPGAPSLQGVNLVGKWAALKTAD